MWSGDSAKSAAPGNCRRKRAWRCRDNWLEKWIPLLVDSDLSSHSLSLCLFAGANESPLERFWRVCVSLNKFSAIMSQRLPSHRRCGNAPLLSFYPRHQHDTLSSCSFDSLSHFCSNTFTLQHRSLFFSFKLFPEFNSKRVSFRATSVPTSSSLRDTTNNRKQRGSSQSINDRRNLPTS